MKNHIRNYILILSIFLLQAFSVNAQKGQDVIRQVTCFDSTLKSQSDSLKLVLYKQGFVVVREATMTMESEYEMPIIVPLNEGSWYHIAFIGDMTSKVYEVRVFDNDERQVIFQKRYAEGFEGTNIISFSYIPKFSEYHMIKPVQVSKKKKQLCGYFIIFKKVK